MLLAFGAIILGLVVLIWSADKFVDGAAATARYAGMPPLLIGMLIVGFGTSAPEMVVSAFAAIEGNPGIAIGNAYGSNIANIGVILGLTALIAAIPVHSSIVRRELPILVGVTLFSGWQIMDGELTRLDAALMLGVFALLVGWTIYTSLRSRSDALSRELTEQLSETSMTYRQALFWLLAGLVLLIISSRILVWGAVSIAQALGVSDLVIGLTIVALGTSLPELASSIAAIRKGEHDIALGNVVGSNLFNTLLVVGIASSIAPIKILPEMLTRDWPVMMAMTGALFLMAFGFRGQARIHRVEGGVFLTAYLAYTAYLIYGVLEGRV